MKFDRLPVSRVFAMDSKVIAAPMTTTVLTSLLLAAMLLSPAHATGLYKWVDEDGQIRYSDRLPPSQVKQGHQQLNKQGIVIEEKDRALTEEEKEAARQAQIEEEKRLAEEAERKAEEARLAAIQREKDKVLLLTFSSEKELTAVFNGRAAVIDSVISLIEKSIITTEEQLQALQARAEQAYTSQGKEVPGGLAQRIEEAIRKIENRNKQLAQKQAERDKVEQTYERDLERFRVLHANDP